MEDSTQKQLVVLGMNNRIKYYICRIAFILLVIFCFEILSVIYAIIFGRFEITVTIMQILKLVLIESVLGFLGISVANFFDSGLFKDRRLSILILSFIVLLSCLQGPIGKIQSIINYILYCFPSVYYLAASADENFLFPLLGAVVYGIVLCFLYIKIKIKRNFI
jgi:hypothetical protein